MKCRKTDKSRIIEYHCSCLSDIHSTCLPYVRSLIHVGQQCAQLKSCIAQPLWQLRCSMKHGSGRWEISLLGISGVFFYFCMDSMPSTLLIPSFSFHWNVDVRLEEELPSCNHQDSEEKDRRSPRHCDYRLPPVLYLCEKKKITAFSFS